MPALFHGFRLRERALRGTGCRLARLAAQRVAIYRRDQAARHFRRHGPGEGALPRIHTPGFGLRPGLLRARGERALRLARRGGRAGRQGLSTGYDQQVVPADLRAVAHLRAALQRGPGGLPPPDEGVPERSRQLPSRCGALRAEAQPLHGADYPRLRGDPLRENPAAERHETPPAGHHEPDRHGDRGGARDRWQGPNTAKPCASTPRTSGR